MHENVEYLTLYNKNYPYLVSFFLKYKIFNLNKKFNTRWKLLIFI